MNIKQFFEAIDYKITEGSKYYWNCFGPDAWIFESFLGGGTTVPSASAIIDNKTQFVYEIEVHDNLNERSYRWIHPDFELAYRSEAKNRSVDPDEAYDSVKFIDLTVEADILEKIPAILRGEEYDDRIQIEINIGDDLLLYAFKEAHKQDITLNKYLENALTTFIDNYNEDE
jgi:hypothetical protein